METVTIYSRAGERIQETTELSQEEPIEQHPKQNPEKKPSLGRKSQV